MRKQRNAAFTDEIITEQKEVSADNNNAKTDGTSGLKMKRKNSYFSGYGTENLGSCPAPFTCRDRLSTNTFLNLGARKSLKYWGFRHRDRIVFGVMEALVYPARELVQKKGRGYEFTIFENETTRLLFWAKRVNDFTIWGRSRL